MAATTTTAYTLESAARVVHVEIFGSPPGAATIATSSIQWHSEFGDEKKYSDSGLGTTYGAHVSCSPPANSTAGFWSNTALSTGNDTIFTMVLISGDVIDVTLEMRLQNGEADTFGAITVASATVGIVYLLPLDYTENGASAKLIPISYTTLL